MTANKLLQVFTGSIVPCAISAHHQCSLKNNVISKKKHKWFYLKQKVIRINCSKYLGNHREYNWPLTFLKGERGEQLTRPGKGLYVVHRFRIIASTRKICCFVKAGRIDYTMRSTMQISCIPEKWTRGLCGKFTRTEPHY